MTTRIYIFDEVATRILRWSKSDQQFIKKADLPANVRVFSEEKEGDTQVRITVHQAGNFLKFLVNYSSDYH